MEGRHARWLTGRISIMWLSTSRATVSSCLIWWSWLPCRLSAESSVSLGCLITATDWRDSAVRFLFVDAPASLAESCAVTLKPAASSLAEATLVRHQTALA